MEIEQGIKRPQEQVADYCASRAENRAAESNSNQRLFPCADEEKGQKNYWGSVRAVSPRVCPRSRSSEILQGSWVGSWKRSSLEPAQPKSCRRYLQADGRRCVLMLPPERMIRILGPLTSHCSCPSCAHSETPRDLLVSHRHILPVSRRFSHHRWRRLRPFFRSYYAECIRVWIQVAIRCPTFIRGARGLPSGHLESNKTEIRVVSLESVAAVYGLSTSSAFSSSSRSFLPALPELVLIYLTSGGISSSES